MEETYQVAIEWKPSDVLYLCPDLSTEDAELILSNLELLQIDGGSNVGLELLTTILRREGYFVLPRYGDSGIP